MAAVVNVGLASNADIYRASWNVLGYGAQKRLFGGITRALYSYGRKPAANAGAAAIEANQPAFSLTSAGAAAVVPRVCGSPSMEMHQVRYFLAVARTLNFTRAADECNVAQPSLTRAIQQLEGELGGDLFRRERPHARLTELGERMLPLLRQCYDSALGARSLASSIKSGEVGSLRIALSATVEVALLMPHILELRKHFGRLQLKLFRGTGAQVADFMKNGEAELAVASTLGDAWDRLDEWPLFTEGFTLVARGGHRLAVLDAINFSDLREEPILMRTYCEQFEDLAKLLRGESLDIDHAHEVASAGDLAAFIEQGLGVAFAPRTAAFTDSYFRASVVGLDFRRTVFLYGVAGRQRTPVANMIMKMLRGADWSQYTV